MLDPTFDFTLIPFEDVRAGAFSTQRISRDQLRGSRIVFARTSRGNLAKMQLRGGQDLFVVRLVVYDPAGLIVRTASGLTIRGSYQCDLDTATEVAAGGDFWWNAVAPGEAWLQPRGGAELHLLRGFEEITAAEVMGADYEERGVERPALADQVLFCRTSRGRFAKLQVQAGDTLVVRRLVVYRPDGTVHLDRANISVPRTCSLDADGGKVTAADGDLWWQVESPSSWRLTPTNGARLSYPSHFRIAKYLPLLRDTRIRAAMVFRDDAGERAYDAWPEADRLMLREFLYLRETGREPPVEGPPALVSGPLISPRDAKKIYLSHVSQSLWVEAGQRVPWRLGNASARHLTYLFDMRALLLFVPGKGHAFDERVMGAVTQWSPSISYAFLRDEGLIRKTQWETILALTEWIRGNLRHIRSWKDPVDPYPSQAAQWEHLFGYRGQPPVDRIIHPLPGRKHVTHGCWGTSGFYAAVLRTVNIPVRHGRSRLGKADPERPDFNLHSRPEFFSVGRSLAHGDDPYERWMLPGHNNIPVERIFHDDASLRAEIDQPTPVGDETPPETAAFNKARRIAMLGVEYMPNYLLLLRCRDRDPRGIVVSTEVRRLLSPYCTTEEIAGIEAACDREIQSIPGGCGAISVD